LILSAAVSCVCELMILLLVAFRLVTGVHKFYFKLVLNKTPNKWRTVGSNGFDRDVLWQDTMSFWQSYTAENGTYLHCESQSCSPDSTVISGKKDGKMQDLYIQSCILLHFLQANEKDGHELRTF